MAHTSAGRSLVTDCGKCRTWHDLTFAEPKMKLKEFFPMQFKSIVRASCVTAAAAFALVGICLQSATSASATASLSDDFVVLDGVSADFGLASASNVPTLKDWQNTRARPPKCKFKDKDKDDED
jgi:hypothetical protein